MTDVDAVVDADRARAWEIGNDDERDTPDIRKAVTELRAAVQAIAEAEKHLQKAADLAVKSPETHRIASLNMSAEDIEIEIRIQIGRIA